ncbi:MAG: bifunctional riboflavin kinase/FAD synthetase [Cocleimonas sp.]
MKLIRNTVSQNKNPQGCVATIGNFDGLHLGHQKIISHLKEKSKELNLPLTVISFEPLPAEYFMPEPPTRIYPLRDKLKLLAELGVDNCLCLRFNANLANMPPQSFIDSVLLKHLNVKYLAVGDDFRFGHQREGDFALLKSVGENAGIQVIDTATVKTSGERVSSTRIRNNLEKGDLITSNKLLGHQYQLSGIIRHGDKRGRTIGFPTLNMKLPENIALTRGVYAVKVHGLSDIALNGVANLGSRPTVNGDENRLETHLFDFNKEVYGSHVCVELLEFIRAEKRFDSFELLKHQIEKDSNKAKSICSSR